ncbi:AAA family ATPase [Burkholderia sp. Tr-20390]|uniref:AAA family ATPase n=1 Tax=Burkholderia sp. Tr-20390 TaxID=2703904 RepID=UPI00197E01FB|nr:AAA family ATPase [Burkholderia sp. Tr-20390]MBN3734832.1 AAA family ATPase [Burkholderia sp. Tr-20390]
MTKQLIIENVKQIDRLVFDIPNPGVHILSGGNGAGKSCLLTCLLRIGRPNAFQTAFLTSKMSDALDPFSGAKITYTVNNNSVAYAYSGERWSPIPKRNSKLLQSFGYASVIYAAANSERIEPRAEDFRPSNVRDASAKLREAAKRILGDEKFEHLKIVNVRRGVGAEAYLMPDASSKPKKKIYFSEKNFSLGEICVLKLLRQLDTCPHHSLVLIDELELALHPRAQVGLLRYLEDIAKEKTLTVIFSTHSANLIKYATRENFFFIERVAGKTRVVSECYPTYALGQLALKEERSPDVVVYVEDEQAQFIVDTMIKSLLKSELANKSKPTIVVAPIGTFSSVIAFLGRSKSLLPDTVRQVALLDKDAHDEYVVPLKKSENHAELAKLQAVKDKIKFLPWTPEVGICKLLMSDIGKHESAIRDFFDDGRISFADIDFPRITELSGGQLRKYAKKVVRDLIDEIAKLTLKSQERVRQDISDYFSTASLKGASATKLKELLMPIINT